MKVRKRLTAMLCAAAMAFSAGGLPLDLGLFSPLPMTVSAESGITYLDADGATKTSGDCTQITNQTTLSAGWYYVDSNVTISSRIEISGDVHLVLKDGCTLTASKGIAVNDDNSLTIYSQSLDESTMGSLVANADYPYAAIGGDSRKSYGTITINGGNITAIGDSSGAGIGSGLYGEGGTITINGGKVSATGGSNSAGIGGGYRGKSGTVTINGGKVTATGSSNSAGIGCGFSGECETITINGGIVTATGGTRGAGIGGGYESSVGTITIKNSTITANGGSSGAGIGGGMYGSAGNIYIENAKVTAQGDPSGIGAGDRYNGSDGSITITDSTVESKKPNGSYDTLQDKVVNGVPEQNITFEHSVINDYDTDFTPTYTVTIPADVNLSSGNATATVRADCDIGSQKLSVTVTSANGYKLKADYNNSVLIPYTLKCGTTTMSSTYKTVLTVTGKSTADKQLNFSVIQSQMYAGSYRDTLTFNISLT